MKAYVTSIGERTTDLCVWSLERQGFDVTVLRDGTTLANKLKRIYAQADEPFVRVDADVICNRNVARTFRELFKIKSDDVWWVQGCTYGWYAQDVIFGGVQFIDKPIIQVLRDNIERYSHDSRPETRLFRMPELYNPRRCISIPGLFGVHGYGQKTSDLVRVKAVKIERGHYGNYDWELMDRINEL